MRSDLLIVLFSVLSPRVSSPLRVYHFVSVPMNWTAAQKYCRQQYTDLATIDGLADVNEMTKAIPSNFINYMWTGLYRMGSTTPLIWSDQSNSTYREWDYGQPNNVNGMQLCVAALPVSGFLNDLHCATAFASVCYGERKRQLVRVEVKSSQNVNDPGVKTDILKKIEQKLKEVRLPEGVTMSWRMSGENVFQRRWYQNNKVSKNLCK